MFRRLFRYVLLALVLLLVALASAFISMRLAIHGREVHVPSLIGMLPRNAEAAANSEGLLLRIEDRFYSAHIPEGRIVSQSPAAGTLVRRGWEVRVAESLGPQQVTIPDLVGQTLRAAEINAHRRGLEIGSIATTNVAGVPADQVVAQDPPAKSPDVTAPRVNLLVSAEAQPTALLMPNFFGHRLGEAAARIQASGLKFAVRKSDSQGLAEAYSSSLANAVVVRQNPAAGAKVMPDMLIFLEFVERPPAPAQPAPQAH